MDCLQDRLIRLPLGMCNWSSELVACLTVSMSEFFYNPEKSDSFPLSTRAHGERGLGSFGKCWNCDVDSKSWLWQWHTILGSSPWSEGLRNAQDLVYEANMDYFNHQLAPELETVYLYSLLTRPLVQPVFESCWLFNRISHLMSQRV